MINKQFIDEETEASIITSKNGEYVKITVQLNRHIIVINLDNDDVKELIQELLYLQKINAQ